jgi:hypothetical protein
VKPSAAAKGLRHRLFVFYHYLYPDNVVSALHMDDLCQGLSDRGWQVTAFPSNRGCRDESLTYPPADFHRGVAIRRVWRPRFRQTSTLGRLLNAAWMISAWSLLALRPDPPAAILIGTDPILSVTVAMAWKLFRPRTRILHWCFDLYPEAAYADKLLAPKSLLAHALESILRHAYAACDRVIAIGPCMLERIHHYRLGTGSKADSSRAASFEDTAVIIVPWALEEPNSVLRVSLEERAAIFGEAEGKTRTEAKLALLYSGNFGRAHVYEEFLALARRLRGENATIAFSVRGNRESELRDAVEAIDPSSVCPIRFVPFATSDRLLERLAAPDVHMLSLAPAWTGTVVPSKFFGALAAGRPVLYSGSPESSVAQWIAQYGLGWLLTPETIGTVATDLLAYVNDSRRVQAMQQNCRDTYHRLFSKQAGVGSMHELLVQLVSDFDTD